METFAAGLRRFPAVLQSVELSLLDLDECLGVLLINFIVNGDIYFPPNGTFCAMDDDLDGKDSCQVRKSPGHRFRWFVIIKLSLKLNQTTRQKVALLLKTNSNDDITNFLANGLFRPAIRYMSIFNLILMRTSIENLT